MSTIVYKLGEALRGDSPQSTVLQLFTSYPANKTAYVAGTACNTTMQSHNHTPTINPGFFHNERRDLVIRKMLICPGRTKKCDSPLDKQRTHRLISSITRNSIFVRTVLGRPVRLTMT